MKKLELSAILHLTGLPVAYRQFPKDGTISLPYVIFYSTGDNNFAADGIAYYTSTRYVIELYMEQRDEETEEKVQNVLTNAGIFWKKEESYIEADQCYLISFKMEG